MFNRRGIITALALIVSACGSGGGGSTTGGDVTSASPLGTAQPAPTPTQTSVPTTITPALTLGAATHFAQGWPLSALQAAKTIGAASVRDGVSWSDIELTPGNYNFTSPYVSFVDGVVQSGVPITLVLQGGNPNYDNGYTPYTDAGRAAFARFAVATLDRFPSVKAIEIGNEFNSQDFVTGPVKDAAYGDRQVYYAKMLKSVYDAVKAKHPNVMVLGGAAHSIPVGYYKVLFEQGALDTMDGIVIHPYTTEPEQLGRQLDVLRAAMGAKQRPIYATEFSIQVDSQKATADYLTKMVSVMAAANVAGADWYALRQQGPANALWFKQVGLSTFSGELTLPGRAFQMMTQKVLNQGAAKRFAIDDFTYAYTFGANTMVIWGEPRSFSFNGSARFYDSTGQEIAKPDRIAADSPITIVSQSPITLGGNLVLSDSGLVADSFDQFDYTNQTIRTGDYAGRWSYYDYSIQRQVLEPLSGLGGGEVIWTSWFPFISDLWRRPLFVLPGSLQVADFSNATTPDAYKVVLRYTSEKDQAVAIKASWTIAAQSADGMDVLVRVNGQTVATAVGKGTLTTNLSGVALRRGDKVDFVVGQNATINGDGMDYRIKIYRS